jgi:putative addiction module component (TIGR02574 family)
VSLAIERLKSELTALTATERAELAQFLIHSLDSEVEDDAGAAWEAELARRAEEIKAGGVGGKPAERVFAEARSVCLWGGCLPRGSGDPGHSGGLRQWRSRRWAG